MPLLFLKEAGKGFLAARRMVTNIAEQNENKMAALREAEKIPINFE